MATVQIDDKNADEQFLELVLQDVWDMVKRTRRRSGKRQETYRLEFETNTGRTVVELTARRTVPPPAKADPGGR